MLQWVFLFFFLLSKITFFGWNVAIDTWCLAPNSDELSNWNRFVLVDIYYWIIWHTCVHYIQTVCSNAVVLYHRTIHWLHKHAHLSNYKSNVNRMEMNEPIHVTTTFAPVQKSIELILLLVNLFVFFFHIEIAKKLKPILWFTTTSISIPSPSTFVHCKIQTESKTWPVQFCTKRRHSFLFRYMHPMHRNTSEYKV